MDCNARRNGLPENAARVEKSTAQGSQRIADKEKAIAGLEEALRQQQERMDQAKAAGNEKETAKAQKALDPISTRLGNARKESAKMQEKQQTESAKVGACPRRKRRKAAAQLREAPAKLEAAQADSSPGSESPPAQRAGASPNRGGESVRRRAGHRDSDNLGNDGNGSGSRIGKSEPCRGLYALAVATEKSIAEQFQSVRAAQVAVQKQIPLSEARKMRTDGAAHPGRSAARYAVGQNGGRTCRPE